MIVGLGPAGPDLLTGAARAAIQRIRRRFVRTTRHPSAGAVPDAITFDSLYESASTLADVYGGIVDAVAEAAAEHGEVLYAVPGSPLVAERTVELLVRDRRVSVELVAGLSFLDLAWARLGVDPIAASVRLVDGHRFAVEAAGERGPLLVAQCDTRSVLSEVKLAVEGQAPKEVVVLQRLGLVDERITTVDWADLDKDVEADHLTSVWIPELAAPIAAELTRFAELVRTLRESCPWDREQTHQTLTRHLLEETYEVLEAIERLESEGPGAGYDHLEEELGDLLFQVVFHATLASESGQFTLADVARRVHDKLVGRHPHVFGEVEADTPGEVMRNWELIKQAEKGAASLMDGIPGHFPSLLYAHKVQRKAASVGIEAHGVPHANVQSVPHANVQSVPHANVQSVPHANAQGVPHAKAQSVSDTADLGALLFDLVNLCREAGVDPEAALRLTAVRFRDRFMEMERLARERSVDLWSAEADVVAALWAEAQTSSPAAS